MDTTMKHYYLAGPMTGIPQHNIPAFDAAAKELRARGNMLITSPAELDLAEVREWAMKDPAGNAEFIREKTGDTWGDFLGRDVKVVADVVDGVIVLPGWAESRGAQLEVFVAQLCGKPILHYPNLNSLTFTFQLRHG